jgi:hypothetical protein
MVCRIFCGESASASPENALIRQFRQPASRGAAAAEPRFGAKQPPLIAGIFADCRNLCGALPVNT